MTNKEYEETKEECEKEWEEEQERLHRDNWNSENGFEHLNDRDKW